MLGTSVTRLSHYLLKAVLASSLSLSLGLSLSAPALASLDQTLGPIPEDTPVLITTSLDPLRWQYPLSKLGELDQLLDLDEFGLDKQVVQDQLDQLKRFFTDDLKFDPALDGLLNLGTHLSVGYRPAAGSEGHLLFSLNLRSGARVSDLLDRLNSEAAKQAGIKMIKQSFGGHELYQIKSPTLMEGEVFRDLTLAVSGNNLIGTLGNGDSLLKNMLYVDQVLPSRSNFRIGNQVTFKPVRESLEKELAWVYIDTLRGLKATGIETLAAGEELEFIGEILSLNRGVGVGFDLNPDGLHFKSFQVPDWASLKPAQREQMTALQAKPVHALKPLLQQVPNQPVFFTAGQRLDISLDPKIGPKLPESLGITDSDQISKNLKGLFNLDYATELLPILDGRYGFGVFANDGPTALPSAVFYLGLKDGKEQAFDKLMQQQFHFSPQALENLVGSSSKASTRSNLYSAQIMVESFATDTYGLYAPSLEALRADGEDLSYWRELTNPVTSLQGEGQAFANYSKFKGTADQIGMIFYEPLGELTELDGVKGYEAYRLYGYDASGELYRLDEDGYESVRDDLPTLADLPFAEDPQAIRPKLRETYQGVEIYSLPLQPLFQELMEEERDPLTSVALSNLHTLQTVTETFAVDQGGIYPESLKALKAAAEEFDYWREFSDPLKSGRSSEQLLADYSEFKGTADQIGMLFYEPVKTGSEASVSYYVVYAYGPDGKLYALSNQEESIKFVNRSDLPQAQAYLEQPEHPLKRVDPVFARQGQLWMLASDPASLKAALDGNQPAKLQSWLNQPPQKSVEPEQVVFLDLESLSSLIKKFQDQDKQAKPDQVMTAILQALKPWRSLFGTVYQVPTKGTEGQLALDVDLETASAQDWVKVGEAYENELQTAQNYARRSSVKANMHTLQTLVETYAVDSEGVYPENLDVLQQAAEKSDYWREFRNPFDAESPSMSDYKGYQPGPDFIGRVFYEPVYDSSGQVTSYKIYGSDEKGALIQDKGMPFILSNY